MGRKRRRRAGPTDEWELIELLWGWPERRDYELIRPSVPFGSPASERRIVFEGIPAPPSPASTSRPTSAPDR